MLKGLVKRNKGASAAVAAALLVLLGSFVCIQMAWEETRREQQARREQARFVAPMFLTDAHRSIAEKKIDYALAQVNVTLDFDPELTEAWLLKGQLLIAQKNFDEAKKCLAEHLHRKPDDADAQKLVELCDRANPDDATVLREFSETLTRQRAYTLAEVMMLYAGDFKDSRQHLFKLYRGRLDVAWPGAGANLAIDGDGSIFMDLHPFRDVVMDLGPLQGMKLNSLSLAGCNKVADLTPLTGMPLRSLDLGTCKKVTNLEPLAGMKLETLNLPPTVGKGLNVVRNIRSLKTIDGKPAAQFWKEYDAKQSGN